jgi:hypothetical protein
MSVSASEQRLARICGVLFLITFVTSIPAAILYDNVLDDTRYILGTDRDAQLLVGAFLEVLLIVANVGTALALYPVLRRRNEGLALGFVTARLVESTFIAVGLLSVLALVTMRQDAVGADDNSLIAIGQSLVAIHDWTFLLGPGFVVGIGNGLILGYLMYTTGLVPRRMAMLGLIGGPLIIASGIAVLFGAIEQSGVVQGIATIPEFLWELSLGIYLTFKGFKQPADTGGNAGHLPMDESEIKPQVAAR